MRPLNPHSDPVGAAPSVPGRALLRAGLAARRLAGFVGGLDPKRMPRFRMVAALVLTASGAYGMGLGGHTIGVVDALAAPLGFTIENIDVEGNRETTEIDVLQVLWATGSQTLPSLDPEAARTTLEAMPWIKSATVAKIYPDRVRIDLVEYEPFALWQKGQELFIVDPKGHEITPFPPERFAGLPLVVGEGAAENAADILVWMEALPELRARVKAYIRVGNRRWDLRLANGVTVRLPEERPLDAMAELVRMDREAGLLSRDVAAVDLRLTDRVVVQLTPGALERRSAAVAERDKIIKRIAKDKPA